MTNLPDSTLLEKVLWDSMSEADNLSQTTKQKIVDLFTAKCTREELEDYMKTLTPTEAHYTLVAINGITAMLSMLKKFGQVKK